MVPVFKYTHPEHKIGHDSHPSFHIGSKKNIIWGKFLSKSRKSLKIIFKLEAQPTEPASLT
jgi:hypothetical protein